MTTRSRKKAPRRAVAEETRGRLMAAGRRAFAAKGLGGTNLREDVLKPAKVSAGSFYHQFDDKVELLLEILRVDGARIRDQVERNAVGGGRGLKDAVRHGFTVYFDMADRNPDFVKIYIREYYSDDRRIRREIRSHNEATIRRVSEILERLNEAGGLRVDAEMGGILIGNLTISVINYYLGLAARQRKAMRERLISSLVELYLGGIPRLTPDEPG